jgi:hypothetical protein
MIIAAANAAAHLNAIFGAAEPGLGRIDAGDGALIR